MFFSAHFQTRRGLILFKRLLSRFWLYSRFCKTNVSGLDFQVNRKLEVWNWEVSETWYDRLSVPQRQQQCRLNKPVCLAAITVKALGSRCCKSPSVLGRIGCGVWNHHFHNNVVQTVIQVFGHTYLLSITSIVKRRNG